MKTRYLLWIMLVLLGPVLTLDCYGADIPRLSIRFLDDPPYQHSWLPWVDDHFRFEMAIMNLSDSTIAIDKATPCNDCNLTFCLRDVADGKEPSRLWEMDALHFVSDKSFVDCAPGESYVDTIDVAEFIEYDLSDGHQYRFWIEYRPTVGYKFKDTLRSTPIWEEPLVSDTLDFTYE